MKTYDIINEASPIPYVKDFLTQGEADAIFSALQALTPVRDRNKRNSTTFIRMLRYGTYVVNPTARTKTVYGPKLDILDLPDILKPLRAKLSEYAGKDINYLSILGYADQYDHINMHQHKEDNVEEDASVYVASFGHIRELVTRPLVTCVNPDCKDAKNGPHMHGTKDRNLYETIMPEHGSLYVLPHSYNTTHEHEVPDSKYECGLRISVNCKHEAALTFRDGGVR